MAFATTTHCLCRIKIKELFKDTGVPPQQCPSPCLSEEDVFQAPLRKVSKEVMCDKLSPTFLSCLAFSFIPVYFHFTQESLASQLIYKPQLSPHLCSPGEHLLKSLGCLRENFKSILKIQPNSMLHYFLLGINFKNLLVKSSFGEYTISSKFRLCPLNPEGC